MEKKSGREGSVSLRGVFLLFPITTFLDHMVAAVNYVSSCARPGKEEVGEVKRERGVLKYVE